MSEQDEQAAGEIDQEQFANLDRHAERNRSADERSDIIEAVPSLIMRGALYTFMATIVITVAIAYFTKIHVKVPAKGEIVPEGQNVNVEAREAGVVVKVHVAAGDRVAAGDPILTLQGTETQIGLRTLRDRLKLETEKRKQLTRAREVVEQVIANPKVVDEHETSYFVDAGPGLVYVNALRNARKQHKKATANIKEFDEKEKGLTQSQIALAEETLRRKRLNLETAKKTLETRLKTLKRKQQDLTQTEGLAERKIVPLTQVNQARDTVISAENQVNEQRQRISQTELEISQSRLSIVNSRRQLTKREKTLRDEWEKAVTAMDQALANLGSAITTYTNNINAFQATITNVRQKLDLQEVQVGHLNIVSPVGGTLTALNFTTAGRLVARGNPVATVVPDLAKPIVIAVLKNKDVAFVKQDIPARVKIDAYPYRQFGTIPAKVVRLYPVPGKALFAVRLELEKTTIKVRGQEVKLRPGLTVEADLLTEKQRILRIIMKKMN